MVDVQQMAETTLGRLERSTVKAELKRVDEVLQPGETVAMLAVGSYKGSGNSLLLLTDHRFIALNETGAWMSKKLQVHDIPFGRISHVSSETGRLGKLTINASGGDIEIDKVLPGERAGEIATYIRDRLQPATSPAPAAPSLADEITKLAELRDSGILTDAEFDAKKADLLSRL